MKTVSRYRAWPHAVLTGVVERANNRPSHLSHGTVRDIAVQVDESNDDCGLERMKLESELVGVNKILFFILFIILYNSFFALHHFVQQSFEALHNHFLT